MNPIFPKIECGGALILSTASNLCLFISSSNSLMRTMKMSAAAGIGTSGFIMKIKSPPPPPARQFEIYLGRIQRLPV